MTEQYKEVKSLGREVDGILRMSDGANIPIDIENRNYQEYLTWVKEGNVPIPPDPLPTQQEITALLRMQAINIFSLNTDGNSKILRAIILVIMDELNILRALHSLAPRVATQIKTAVQNKINSGDSD